MTLYSGDAKGDWYVGFDQGFSGYESRSNGRWYRFMTPTLSFGRLFSNRRGSRYSRRILIPCWLYDAYKRFRDPEWL